MYKSRIILLDKGLIWGLNHNQGSVIPLDWQTIKPYFL